MGILHFSVAPKLIHLQHAQLDADLLDKWREFPFLRKHIAKYTSLDDVSIEHDDEKVRKGF